MLTLSAAVKAAGVSLSTLRRHLAAGRIAGAVRTETGWSIPISGLIAAGYMVRTTPPDDTPAPASRSVMTPASDTAALEAENLRLRQTVERLEADYDAQRRHLADLQKALDVLARSLPVAPPASQIPTGVEPTDVAPLAQRRRWWRRS
jgi:hypothetical protein